MKKDDKKNATILKEEKPTGKKTLQRKINNLKRQKRHRQALQKKSVTRIEFKVRELTKKQIKELSKKYNLDRTQLLEKWVEMTLSGSFDQFLKNESTHEFSDSCKKS